MTPAAEMSSLPRILVLGPLPPPLNGMTIMTVHALEALRREGFRVTHVDTSDHRSVGNVGRLDPRNVVLALIHAVKVGAAVFRERPTLLYLPIAQGTLGFLRDALFLLPASLARIPCVVHFHGAEFDSFYRDASPVIRGLIRTCFSSCARVLVLTSSSRHMFDGLVPQERVSVLSNGIPELPRFIAPLPRPGPLRVLFLSNLIPRKGYLDVLEAANQVRSVLPDVEFVIAGEWLSRDEELKVRAMARSRGIDKTVAFSSSVSGLRKQQMFAGADIFVFPPRRPEGQGLVILEAMSAGLPVVSTPLGGIRDTVRDGATGLFVDPESPQELADALIRLLQDRQKRIAMGIAGREDYTARFTEHLFQQDLCKAIRIAAADTADPSRDTSETQ